MPRVPCRSARQQLTAAACSALFRVRTPASARPDGLRRLPQQHSGRVLRRVCHARMRWCARLCTLRRMRRISLRHYEKKPALRQRRPRGAGRPALKWAACPAAFLRKKRPLHRARPHRKARLFCGRYRVAAASYARGLRRPCRGVFSGMRLKTKVFYMAPAHRPRQRFFTIKALR